MKSSPSLQLLTVYDLLTEVRELKPVAESDGALCTRLWPTKPTAALCALLLPPTVGMGGFTAALWADTIRFRHALH